MEKSFFKRLVRTALISSPIIALYGVTPVYIFNKVQPLFLFFAGLGVMLNVFIFWAINIAIIRYSPTSKQWLRYTLSYCFVVAFHSIFIFLRTVIPPPEFIQQNGLRFGSRLLMTYPFAAVLASNTIVLIICNSILATEKSKKAEIEIQELKVSNLEAQKQVLMQQLQPHFLFNTLSVLKSLIQENAEEAENYAIKLSEFLRYSLQFHKSDLVTVEQELNFTNHYIDLQRVRFGSSLIFYVNVPKEVYMMEMPAFALQTLVENAIKHNVFTEKKPLRIKIEYTDNSITVCNNKLLNKVAETTGTGLENLKRRYKLIANKEIEVAESKDEFSVKVNLLNSNYV